MAVRDDWAPGEVLTSTDLNDTFAAKSDAAYQGLTLITSQSFTSQASVSVNNVFTSTYRNYRMILNISAPDADIRMRMRASSSDYSGNEYSYAVPNWLSFAGFDGVSRGDGVSSWFIGPVFSGVMIIVDIGNPQVASQTNIALVNSPKYQTRSAWFQSGVGTLNTTTQYDGFTIYPASSNTTGWMRIYGYKD